MLTIPLSHSNIRCEDSEVVCSCIHGQDLLQLCDKDAGESQGKRSRQSGRNQVQSSSGLFPPPPVRGVTQSAPPSQVRPPAGSDCLRDHWRLRLEVFIGGWSREHPLASTFPNSRAPVEKQVFSIHHIVCAIWGHRGPLGGSQCEKPRF